MMNFTCNECNDSGSRDKLGTYLDCNACGTAAIRRDLNDFVKSLGPTHPEDVALAIHQRALAIGLADSVEGVLTEMQPGGALHMPQEPVAHLKYWAAQRWSGCGDHEIEHGEGLEVCEPGEIGADGQPAFPVFMHAIPALAMAPKQEALPEMTDDRIFQWAEGYVFTLKGMPHKMTFSRPRFVAAVRTIIANLPAPVAAPAAANGAPELPALPKADVEGGYYDAESGFTKKAMQEYALTYGRAILAAAGPNAALVKALESALAIINNEADPKEYATPLKAIRAALSGAKGN